MLRDLPIFPLPIVLFPGAPQPLHIFEPRYREMVADALSADRMIAMMLLRPGWERDYEGWPAVYPIGCSGVITHAETLPDGRYNIVLRGVERVRLMEEDRSRSYRLGLVEPLGEGLLNAPERAEIRACRAKLESLLAPAVEKAGADAKMPAAMSDEDLINALAQYLDLEPLEKQALLEQPCLRTRAASLVELLEMKMMAARAPGGTHAVN